MTDETAEYLAAWLKTHATPIHCATCHRPFAQGEQAWSSDWKVLDDDGWRNETRWTCDDCEAAE
jgi:hypothetical protein